MTLYATQAELALEYSILLVAEMKTEGSRTVAGLVLVWCLADEVQVIELAVHPDYRRQGIGLALMSEALALGTRYTQQLDNSNYKCKGLLT